VGNIQWRRERVLEVELEDSGLLDSHVMLEKRGVPRLEQIDICLEGDRNRIGPIKVDSDGRSQQVSWLGYVRVVMGRELQAQHHQFRVECGDVRRACYQRSAMEVERYKKPTVCLC
jgi:hypothetical protein